MEKAVAVILILSLCLMPVQIQAKSVTSGTDDNGNKWTYHTSTKTLTFTGDKAISDFTLNGHDREPSWYRWSNKTEHMVIEEGITGIGRNAFADFVNAKTVVLPDSVRVIGEDAFENNQSLRTIKIPNGVVKIGNGAFVGCEKLEEIQMPAQIKKIGRLEGCKKIKSICFPDTVNYLEEGILWGCEALTNVKLPCDLKEIKPHDFSDCRRLKRIILPKRVKSVSMSAFAGTGLKKISLPSKVHTIKRGTSGRKVFSYEKGLTYPTKNLRVIEIHSKKVKSIQKNSFSGLSSKVVIKVPKSKKKKYTKMLRKSGLSKKVKICNL